MVVTSRPRRGAKSSSTGNPPVNVPNASVLKSFLGRLLPPLPLVFPCLLSGVLLTLCFPVVSLGPVSFLALTPLFVAALRYKPTRREAYRAGFLTGFACYVTMLWWIVKLIP